MDIEPCTCFPDYFALISSVLSRKKLPEQTSALLFRGQADADWKLEPSLQRKFKDHAIYLREAERKMLRELKASAPYLMPVTLQNDWDLLSLAQHYGMETRLLDWSTNPLVGLWFALSETRSADAAVWIFRPKSTFVINPLSTHEKPLAVTGTRVFKPTSHSPRIANQSGWHTVHRFSEDEGLVALDNMKVHSKYLIKVVIKKEHRLAMLKAVEKAGVTATSVFGDLVGFCQHISDANQPSSFDPPPPPPRKNK